MLVSTFKEQRESRIHIAHGLLSSKDTWSGLDLGARVAILSNETVKDLYGPLIEGELKVPHEFITIGDGEEFKTLDTFAHVIGKLIELGFHRDSTIIALGGGVVGDLAGFIAATYQRGVKLIQIPTTLLAQVDSAVGGKTAVNHDSGKNLIGAFYQPHEVLIDTQTLSTLPSRVYIEGLAEVIKYGVIYDTAFFEWLEDNVDAVLQQQETSLVFMVQRCCEIKSEVVKTDEKEGGLRKILNFGHTFGHALESTLGYGSLYHGEAVSIGMVMASHLAHQIGLCEERVALRIQNILLSYGLPTLAPPETDPHEVIQAMAMDKKVVAGQIHFVLPEYIGKTVITNEVPQDALLETIQNFIQPQNTL